MPFLDYRPQPEINGIFTLIVGLTWATGRGKSGADDE